MSGHILDLHIQDNGICDLSDIKELVKQKCVLAKTLKAHFTNKQLFGMKWDYQLGLVDVLTHFVTNEHFHPLLGQLLWHVAQDLESLLLEAGGATKDDPKPPVQLRCLGFHESLGKGTLNHKLATYVNACVEAAARHSMVCYAADGANPCKLKVINAALVYPDNTLAMCCPSVLRSSKS